LLGHDFLGTTEATWSKTLGVGATQGITRSTLNTVIKVKERLLVDSLDDDWSRLVVTGSLEDTKYKNHGN
jgi:hypothetical protein